MKNTGILIGGALVVYGGYGIYQYKVAGTTLSDTQRTVAGASMLLGLVLVGYSYIGLKK